jgi:hypothetical protein
VSAGSEVASHSDSDHAQVKWVQTTGIKSRAGLLCFDMSRYE